MISGGQFKPKIILTLSRPISEKLKIFMCHASEDKVLVRRVYEMLNNFGYAPWLDEQFILPGQEWDEVIRNEIVHTDVIMIFLSSNSVSKVGYVQKEIKQAIDISEYQPEGRIFIIPIKLNACIIPQKLTKYQFLDYDTANAKEKLISTLEQIQKQSLSLKKENEEIIEEVDLFLGHIEDLDLVLEKSFSRPVLMVVYNAEEGSTGYKLFLKELFPIYKDAVLEDEIFFAFGNKTYFFSKSLLGNQLNHAFKISSAGAYLFYKRDLIAHQSVGFFSDKYDYGKAITELFQSLR